MPATAEIETEIKPVDTKAVDEVVKADEKPADKPPTPEEIEAMKKEFLDSAFPTSSYAQRAKVKPVEKDIAAPPEEKVDEVEEVKPPVPPVEPKPKETTKPPVKQAKEKPLSDRVAEETADRIASAVESRLDKKPKPTQDDAPEPALSDEAQAKLEVIAKLESIDPRYAGYAKLARDFFARDASRIAEWEKNNPGEEYNPSDKEHAEFYKTHEPVVIDKDFAKAEKAISKERFDREVTEAVDRRLRPVEFRTRLRDEMPAVHDAADSAVTEFVAGASPEFAALMTGEDGAKALTAESVKKFKEEFPAEDRILEPEAEKMRILGVELDLLARFPRDYRIDLGRAVKIGNGESFKPHAELQEFADALESGLASSPPETTTRKDGRRFITQAAMRQRVTEIESAGMGEQKKRDALGKLFGSHWTMDMSDIRRAIIVDRAEKTRQKLAEITELVTLKTKSAKTPVAPSASNGENKEVEKAPVSKLKVAPPSTAASSDKVATTGKPNGVGVNSPEEINKGMGWA